METTEQLNEVILKLVRLELETKDPRKLCLKAKAVGAVSEWLKAEREKRFYNPRLAPI